MADRSHILIVEDDPLVVDVMVASLESRLPRKLSEHRGSGACILANVARGCGPHRQNTSRRPRH